MFVVFVATLARPAIAEADALAATLGSSPYDTRLLLAAGPPSVVLITQDRNRAADVLAVLRARGHSAHVFDDENFVSSIGMTRFDDFVLEPEGVRRTSAAEFLPFGDIYAIVRAVHETSAAIEERADASDGLIRNSQSIRMPMTRSVDREHVAYFFRRSGEKPWLLRERHTSYVGLGSERGPIAFANFGRLLERVRGQASMAVFDDRLVRRRVAERAGTEGQRSSRDGMDMLAHLLAMTIASQGGSPYR